MSKAAKPPLENPKGKALSSGESTSDDGLLDDIRQMIEASRERVATTVNTELALLYWNIGRRTRKSILGPERAAYGKQVLKTLSEQLTSEYSSGFNHSNLTRMVKFADLFPDEQIVATLSQRLGWSHFVELIALDDPLKRQFYSEICRVERWSVRTLRSKIQGMLFERTALSRKPEKLALEELETLRASDQMSPDLVFRDPYLLHFLGLKDTFSEKDLEAAILKELELFIMELGTDFSFVARQKRMTIDGEDYCLDLLFYHRNLRRLVAIELKLGKFRAADKGQMELYLGWLDKHDRRPGEESPLGLILCAEKTSEHVELLHLDQTGIRVAEYLTEFPSSDVFEKKLHESIKRAQERLAMSPYKDD